MRNYIPPMIRKPDFPFFTQSPMRIRQISSFITHTLNFQLAILNISPAHESTDQNLTLIWKNHKAEIPPARYCASSASTRVEGFYLVSRPPLPFRLGDKFRSLNHFLRWLPHELTLGAVNIQGRARYGADPRWDWSYERQLFGRLCWGYWSKWHYQSLGVYRWNSFPHRRGNEYQGNNLLPLKGTAREVRKLDLGTLVSIRGQRLLGLRQKVLEGAPNALPSS